MAEIPEILEISVTLFRPGPSARTLGLSLRDTGNCPPIVTRIAKNSPAARCKKIKVGDYIIEINREDVQAYTARDVMKYLKLAQNPITLTLIRDFTENNQEDNQLEHNFSEKLYHNMDVSPPIDHDIPSFDKVAKTSSNKIKIPKCESVINTDNGALKVSLNAEFDIIPEDSEESHHLKKKGSSKKYQKDNPNSVRRRPVKNKRQNIAKRNSRNTSPIHPPHTNISKYIQESHSKNHFQSDSQYPMSSTTSTDTEDEDITPPCKTSLKTCIKPLEKKNKKVLWADNVDDGPYEMSDLRSSLPNDKTPTSIKSLTFDRQRTAKEPNCDKSHRSYSDSMKSCPEVQDTIDSDFLIKSSESKVIYSRDDDLNIKTSPPEIKKQSTIKQYPYHTNTDHQTIKQRESPDKINPVKSIEKNNNYYNDKESINNKHQYLIDNNENTSYYSHDTDFLCDNLHDTCSFLRAVDIPSAGRLAKHLFYLEGFKNSDVFNHLNKKDRYSEVVGEKYMTHFDFKDIQLDVALNIFLKHLSLSENAQEIQELLIKFSKRYLNCNPRSFSFDAVYTLTCSIMELNSNLHNPTISPKINLKEFVKSLYGLNDSKNFSRHFLKSLYNGIKYNPLELASEYGLNKKELDTSDARQSIVSIKNKIPEQINKSEIYRKHFSTQDMVYNKGYLLRKHCKEEYGRKTFAGKRCWKVYYCTLQNLFLYFHKVINNSEGSMVVNSTHKAIHLHHSLATRATDYLKKQHVFRLVIADGSEYLFQTQPGELESWVDSINFVCAVENQKKFPRSLSPSTLTKFELEEIIRDHENTIKNLKAEISCHQKEVLAHPNHGSLFLQPYHERTIFLDEELMRFKTYANLLKCYLNPDPVSNLNSVSMEVNNEEKKPKKAKKYSNEILNRTSMDGAAKYDTIYPRQT